jgi:formamidopyrimidine-DNA glycosylase
MPELAEVELSRRIWDTGERDVITRVSLHPRVRIFRGIDTAALARGLTGASLVRSHARGKQLAFVFELTDRAKSVAWLGIHLGMSGSLQRVTAAEFVPGKHDHLVLWQLKHALVFRDVRQFGRVLLHVGVDTPKWWMDLAPDLTSPEFTLAALKDFLRRRSKSPIKAVLLMQQRFPGIGNWLADEILWWTRIHPAARSGQIPPNKIKILWREIRRICREAIRRIDEDWNYPPSWLFRHRWKPGGKCPRCRTLLRRATIGGRTTCWCPHCQPAAKSRGRRNAGL